MADLKVVSREYKVMLKASRFAGDESRLLEAAGRFWPERLEKDTQIEVVDKFAARELVIGGGVMQLGKSRKIPAECALIVWYDHANPNKGQSPLLVEFSFRYGDGSEDYGGGSVHRAYEAFNLLQHGLPDWVDEASKTKTAFVYG